MSLETALDDERRDVLALLEGRSVTQPAVRRAASPGVSPSAVRSMLDVGFGTSPAVTGRRSSLTGYGHTSSLFAGPSHRSQAIHDPAGPRAFGLSTPHTLAARSKSSSMSRISPRERTVIEKDYDFEMYPTNEHASLPKRVTQGGKKARPANVFIGDDNLRSDVTKALLGLETAPKSPFGLGGRSASPITGNAPISYPANLPLTPNTWLRENGEVIDMSRAYKQLSDAAPLKSDGPLSPATIDRAIDSPRGQIDSCNHASAKDNEGIFGPDQSHSSDDDWNGRPRGRVRRRQGEEAAGEQLERCANPACSPASADEQSNKLMANAHVSSLLDGVGVGGKSKAAGHRNASQPRVFVTPHDTEDEEEMDDIRRAQSLQMNVSPINSNVKRHRCIRQILRGNYQAMVDEAAQGLRRQRLYLVATDLSEEAAYALEWTIGTVLKDGDTLLATCAIDGADSPEFQRQANVTSNTSTAGLSEAAKMMKDTAEMVRVLSSTDQTVILPHEAEKDSTAPRDHHPSITSSTEVQPTGSAPPTVANLPGRKLPRSDFAGLSRAEEQRWRNTEEVTERCISLLRKTKLQVRVVIDVFHCKSPKHMITEVIDYLEPTLVILGSRNRSAIRGALLGSFSNYLVTKSSVPVMVARKRLRKQSKALRPTLRFTNVLHNPAGSGNGLSGLAAAKIDKMVSSSS